MIERNFLQMFHGILSSQSFELLAQFDNESLWPSMEKEEKDALSQLFLIHGERCMRSSAPNSLEKAKSAFLSACRLTPHSSRTWFRYGGCLALSAKISDLEEASRAFQKSIELDNRFFDAHYALASVFLRIGAQKHDESVLSEADRSFLSAYTLLSDMQSLSALPSELFWHWALVHFLIGQKSGEASDFQKACSYFQKAYEGGLKTPEFFNDYANTLVELSLLINRLEYIERAARLYEEALVEEQAKKRPLKNQAVRLFNSGCCYVHLFDLTLDLDYFYKAEAAFLQSSLLYPLDVIWNKLGQVYFIRARATHKREHAEKAIECFQKAFALGMEHPVMLSYYAQALLLVHESVQNPSLIQDAEQLAELAMHAEEKEKIRSAEPYLAWALCRYELGKYFEEDSYLEEAQEILQKSLSEHPKSAHLWHALGRVKYAFLDEELHEDRLKEAAVCFLIASKSIVTGFHHFWNDWGLTLLALSDALFDPFLAEEALLKFQTAVELSSFAEMDWLYNYGCALDLLGCLREDEELYERALEIFTYILDEDPTCVHALFQQATVHIHLGAMRNSLSDYQQAESLLRKYLLEEPEDEIALEELGFVSLCLAADKRRKDQEKEAFEYLQEAERALHSAVYLGNFQAYYHLACLHAFLHNFPEAMEYLWKADEYEALPPVKEILEDEWLEPLFPTVSFRQFIHEVSHFQQIVSSQSDE